MSSLKNVWIAMVVVTIIAIGGYIYPSVQKSMGFGAAADCGSTTCLSGGLSITSGLLQSNGTFQIGSSGTALTQVLSGKCALIYSNPSVVASTTKAFDCAVTGVVDGDKVFAQTSTTTSATGPWIITGASASTTSGFITLQVTNNSGATAAVPREIASSTPYLVVR